MVPLYAEYILITHISAKLSFFARDYQELYPAHYRL